MRVLHLNASDSAGGAARAMLSLHEALRTLGVESRILCAERRVADPRTGVVPLTAFGRAMRRAKDERWVWSNRTERSNTHFTLLDHEADALAHPFVREADVLHLHWTTGLLSIDEIGEILASGKPCVWTFHDEWAYTGGCHFTAGCDAWRTGCDACPQLREDPQRLVARQFARKAAAYRRGNMVVVGPSAWIAARSRASALLSHMPAVTIANGVDLEVFHPSRRDAGRALLGVDASTAVLLFGAGSAAERRKGLPQLRAALARLAAARAQHGLDAVTWKVVVVGEPGGVEMPPDAVVLGHVADRERLASIVAAADLALLPSLEDNLPNFVAEALACGTPCVAFAAGGVPEMLDGLPGCALAPVGDSEALAERIASRLRELEATRAARPALRAVAEQRYSQIENARRYLGLYEAQRASASAARQPNRVGGQWSRWRTGVDLRVASLFLRLLRRELRATPRP